MNKNNLYELLAKLREFEYKLLEVNEKNISYSDIDIILLNAKAYIFDNELLREEFLKKQKQFYKETQTEKYKKRYESIYKEIKNYSIKKSQENNRKLVYFKTNSKESKFLPYNAKVEENNHSCHFCDIPELYYYPSIRASKKDLSKKIFPIDNDCENLKIVSNLQAFYLHIDINTAKIRYFEDTFQDPKNYEEWKEKSKEIQEANNIIPTDLEIFIASGDFKIDIFFDCFKFFFYASSVMYVILMLQKYVQEQILKNYYSNSKMPTDKFYFMNNWTKQYKEIFNILYENPNTTINEIKNVMGVSPSRINNIINDICSKLGLNEQNLRTLRLYINNLKKR